MIHPFIEKAMIEHARATSTEIFQIAQPNVMVTENQNLTVTDIELVVHENNRSNYRAHLGPKKSVALDRVGQWIDQWKGTIYGGTSTAAEVGTRVHNAINCILQGKAEAAAYQLEGGEDEHCFDLFLNWFQKNWFMKTLATEATVWHLGLGIAGTLDLLMANQQYDQQITLIDFKTTNNMVRKYPLQLYLYAFCLAKIGVNVGRAVIVSLPKPSQGNQWSELVLWDDRFPGTSKVLILSLRAGAGIDGLQHVCRTCVFGELDWSPGVHEQCLGRVYRDGQPDPVVAYYLLAEEGADPIMSDVLGVKRGQIEGLRDPDAPLVEAGIDPDHLKRLAKDFLERRGEKFEEGEAIAC